MSMPWEDDALQEYLDEKQAARDAWIEDQDPVVPDDGECWGESALTDGERNR